MLLVLKTMQAQGSTAGVERGDEDIKTIPRFMPLHDPFSLTLETIARLTIFCAMFLTFLCRAIAALSFLAPVLEAAVNGRQLDIVSARQRDVLQDLVGYAITSHHPTLSANSIHR